MFVTKGPVSPEKQNSYRCLFMVVNNKAKDHFGNYHLEIIMVNHVKLPHFLPDSTN